MNDQAWYCRIPQHHKSSVVLWCHRRNNLVPTESDLILRSGPGIPAVFGRRQSCTLGNLAVYRRPLYERLLWNWNECESSAVRRGPNRFAFIKATNHQSLTWSWPLYFCCEYRNNERIQTCPVLSLHLTVIKAGMLLLVGGLSVAECSPMILPVPHIARWCCS